MSAPLLEASPRCRPPWRARRSVLAPLLGRPQFRLTLRRHVRGSNEPEVPLVALCGVLGSAGPEGNTKMWSLLGLLSRLELERAV